MCVCNLRYPTCNAHAPYCHLCPAPLYNIFPHYLINGTIFEKKLLNTKCVFWFSLQLFSESFLILRWTQRDFNKMLTRLHVKHLLFLSDFFYGTLKFFSTYFFLEKYTNTKFHENPSSASRVVPCGRKKKRIDMRADR